MEGMTAPAPEHAPARVALMGLLLLGAVGLTAGVHRLGVDSPWREWVIDKRSGTLDTVFTVISTLGSSLVLAPLAVVLVIVLTLRGFRSDALLVSVTTMGALVFGPLLKSVVERPRPEHGHLVVVNSWAYPSGHSLTSMAVLGVLIALAARHLPNRPARITVIALGVLMIVAVGLSRVYLGVHWPTDVLAGWLIGSVWLGLCLFLFGRHARRGSPAESPQEPQARAR